MMLDSALGLGFTFRDLAERDGLVRLDQAFLQRLEQAEPALHVRLLTARAEPEQLQKICDSLGPDDLDRVFRKWLQRIPLPLRTEDRESGYDWDLSIWQGR